MISFISEGKKFNYRVGAIILNKAKTKVLLHTIDGFGFYLLPGGRVEWLENCQEAIKRELKEEIGLDGINPRERLLLENFFVFKDVEFQEVSLNFVIELDERHSKLEEKSDFYGLEGVKYIYKWVDIADIDKFTIKPQLLKGTIKNHSHQFEYFVVDERK